MNCLEIIKRHLKTYGYDGLYNPDGKCACEINDLNPCCSDISECSPGYKIPCDCGDHDFHIGFEQESEG